MENPIWKIQKNLENPMENTINDAYNMENPYGKWMMPMGCQKSIQTTTFWILNKASCVPKAVLKSVQGLADVRMVQFPQTFHLEISTKRLELFSWENLATKKGTYAVNKWRFFFTGKKNYIIDESSNAMFDKILVP